MRRDRRGLGTIGSMPRRPAPLPHPLLLGPFGYREAVEAGVTRRRLGHADIARLHRGLYASVGAADLRARCLQARPLLGETRWYSHLTAARLWECPVPFAWGEEEPLHVLALPGGEPLRRPGIVGWESADGPVGTLIDGIPLTLPAHAWTQLSVPGATGTDAATGQRFALSREWLVAVGDYLLTGPRTTHGRHPLCTAEQLAEAARAHRGKRGAKAIAWALDRVRPGPQSPRESLLRLALVDHGLPEPEIQPAIVTAGGIRHPDLGYLDERLLIEYQGDHHRTDRSQWREDLTRRQLFEDADYRVMEVAGDDLHDGGTAVAARVRRALVAARRR